jgi:hypothetical protein
MVIDKRVMYFKCMNYNITLCNTCIQSPFYKTIRVLKVFFKWPHVIAMAFDIFTSIGLISLRG